MRKVQEDVKAACKIPAPASAPCRTGAVYIISRHPQGPTKWHGGKGFGICEFLNKFCLFFFFKDVEGYISSNSGG